MALTFKKLSSLNFLGVRRVERKINKSTFYDFLQHL